MEQFLSIVGFLSLSYLCINLILRLWTFLRAYVLPGFGLKDKLKSYGSWAVVTGCTDGIGQAYARQLAELGLNIILISRSQERLDNTAAEIEEKYNVKTKKISVDFTGSQEIYTNIAKELGGMDIGVLVNNVGMSLEYPEYFGDISADKLCPIINCNILSCTMMTHTVLPGMVERERGVIINISSGAGMQPVPFLGIYSATKAYMRFLSDALDFEYKKKGIVSQCVMPFFVSTKLSKMWNSSIFVPKPEAFVRQALGTLGTELDTNGFWSHAVQCFVMVSIIPQWLGDLLTAKGMLAARRRALKKLQKGK